MKLEIVVIVSFSVEICDKIKVKRKPNLQQVQPVQTRIKHFYKLLKEKMHSRDRINLRAEFVLILFVKFVFIVKLGLTTLIEAEAGEK